MAKQQTLTIVVPDNLADPADLVQAALTSFISYAHVVFDDEAQALNKVDRNVIVIIEER